MGDLSHRHSHAGRLAWEPLLQLQGDEGSRPRSQGVSCHHKPIPSGIQGPLHLGPNALAGQLLTARHRQGVTEAKAACLSVAAQSPSCCREPGRSAPQCTAQAGCDTGKGLMSVSCRIDPLLLQGACCRRAAPGCQLPLLCACLLLTEVGL